MAHLLKKLITKEVIHERLLPVGPYLPIRVRRHAQQGHVLVIAIFILRFEAVGLFRVRTPDVQEVCPKISKSQSPIYWGAPRIKARRPGVKFHNVAMGPRPPGDHVCRNGGAAIEHQDGQIRVEITQGRIHQQDFSAKTRLGKRPDPDWKARTLMVLFDPIVRGPV